VRFLSRTRTLNAPFPIAQNFLHVSPSALQCLNICLDTLEFVLGKLVHATAWSTPSITSFQNFSQLSQSESDPERPLHDKNSLQCARRIDSVTRLCSRGSWQNTDPFIMSNRVWTHARRLGQVPGTKRFLNRYFAPQQYQPLNAFQSQAVSFRSELHIGRWLKAGRFFEDIQERSRAVDSVALRIAYSFHDTRTFQSFDGCTA
jgi:hypothetical protein